MAKTNLKLFQSSVYLVTFSSGGVRRGGLTVSCLWSHSACVHRLVVSLLMAWAEKHRN